MALLVSVVLIPGCGGEDDRGASASGNATDAAFITAMTAHHEDAIEMAGVARARAERPELRKLADGIIRAQKGDIAVMRRIRAGMRHMGTQDRGHMGMSEAAMGMDMPMLRRSEPLDREFLDQMVPHHRGAIRMARVEIAQGMQPGLRRMAENMIETQTDEIGHMRRERSN